MKFEEGKMCDDVDHSPTSDDINLLFDEIESGNKGKHQSVMQKLQSIRLWQLKQQEELKKQQQTQLALLKSQALEATLSNDEKEDEILAVPLSNLNEELNPIAVNSIVSNENSPVKQTNNVCDDLTSQNDLLLNIIREEMVSNKGATSNTEKNLTSENFQQHLLKGDTEQLNLNQSVDSDVSLNKLHSDIETSFEKISSKPVAFDDVPVKSGKTFEELLTQQLAQENPVIVQKKDTNASTPKRPFLRKGQGIARFNGPPKKSKLKKKPLSKETCSHPIDVKYQQLQLLNSVPDSFDENSANFKTSVCKSTSKDTEPLVKVEEIMHVPPRPCIRKTARLTRREPMKQLTLKSDAIESSQYQPIIDFDSALLGKQVENSDHHNESRWSEDEDTVLALDVTNVNTFNATSNETFEQMEEFCNEFYADVSTVKTLESDDSVIMQKIKPLPTNKLMLQLFPTLRHENNLKSKEGELLDGETEIKSVSAESEKASSTICSLKTCTKNTTSPVSSNAFESAHSETLKNKLEEMQSEIKRFQVETAKLSVVRKEEEDQLQSLRQEFEEFQRQKEEELERLAQFKKSEIKKLKKDRKLFEEHAAAAKAVPNKKDREYIQELESKCDKMLCEFKLKEQRLNAVNGRLRSQLETAVEENEKLKTSVKKLEDIVHKYEAEKESRKTKKSQAAWKAINEIVDSIPISDENANVDDYIESHLQPSNASTNSFAKSLPLRSPLSSCNSNIQNSSDVMIHEGKVERRKKDGSLEISFRNGTKKLLLPDGTTQIMFVNGDIKTVYPDGTVKYHYTVSGTWHTTHPNGMQVIEFSNKQIERHFPDGSKHITFEDGSTKMIKANGSEEAIFTDGTVMVISPSGDKTIEYSNGQREIHTSEFKRREYPDGTCKTVFIDGRQETKYSSGRLRIKDANGVLIVDKVLS